ncbi:LysR substrate-binding domain-containing protein [Stenotrophomonas indicatrix]
MERRHLQYYVALAEELHFGRTALRLGIATPTLSVQIQEIERRLGTPLFDRSRREVTLTSAGAIFLAEARNVLRQFEQAEAVGRRAGRGEIGRIEIGYVGSAVHAGALQEQLQRFRSASPDVVLQVGEWPMADLPDLLLDGRIDVVFCRLPMEVPDALGSHILIEDQFCVALPASHALAHSGVPVQPSLLAKEAFIMPEQPAGTLEVARRGGFVPDIRSRPGHLAAVLAQVSVGDGAVAIVPSVLQRTLLLPGMVYLPIAGPVIASTIAALYREQETSPAVRRLIEQVRRTPSRRIDMLPLP